MIINPWPKENQHRCHKRAKEQFLLKKKIHGWGWQFLPGNICQDLIQGFNLLLLLLHYCPFWIWEVSYQQKLPTQWDHLEFSDLIWQYAYVHQTSQFLSKITVPTLSILRSRNSDVIIQDGKFSDVAPSFCEYGVDQFNGPLYSVDLKTKEISYSYGNF